MKNHKIIFYLGLLLFVSSLSFCQKSSKKLKIEDKEALLFMYEEEKLARDTYTFLDNKWGIEQFANIKGSEQKHMDAIAGVLDNYNISYETLENGKFSYKKLQDLYDDFAKTGIISKANALEIGATIEDLDIVDLQEFENASNNNDVISVFSNLRCGSRNHIRAFVSTITSEGNSYSPQFLNTEDYTTITTGDSEKCGKQ